MSFDILGRPTNYSSISCEKSTSILVADADCSHCESGVRCDDVAGCSQCLGYNDPPHCIQGNDFLSKHHQYAMY